jgi:hypothetical protein
LFFVHLLARQFFQNYLNASVAEWLVCRTLVSKIASSNLHSSKSKKS